ncbi:hypothetical protein Emag_000094 [Eimeria magna]
MAALAKACQLVQQSWAASPRDTSQAAVSVAVAAAAPAAAPAAAAAAAAGAEVAHSAKSKSGDVSLEQLPPHPSHLGFVARIFVEAFWMRLEKEAGIDRQQLGKDVRLNGPLGSDDPDVDAQWLPGTVHLSVRGANGYEMACGLAVSLSPFSSSSSSRRQMLLHMEAGVASRQTQCSGVRTPGVRGRMPRVFLREGEEEGLFVSAGVSCHQGAAECSAALKAMGLDEAWGLGSLRISLGRHSTPAEALEAAGRLARFLRAASEAE